MQIRTEASGRDAEARSMSEATELYAGLAGQVDAFIPFSQSDRSELSPAIPIYFFWRRISVRFFIRTDSTVHTTGAVR